MVLGASGPQEAAVVKVVVAPGDGLSQYVRAVQGVSVVLFGFGRSVCGGGGEEELLQGLASLGEVCSPGTVVAVSVCGPSAHTVVWKLMLDHRFLMAEVGESTRASVRVCVCVGVVQSV